MADNSKPGGRSHLVAWMAALVILIPILYILSVGPAAVLVHKTGDLKSPYFQTLDAIYMPLEWLCNHNKHFGNFLEAYLKLFGVT